MTSCAIFQPEKAVSINKLKEAFFSVKVNKSTGYDGIIFNIVKKCFGTPLWHVFHLSIQRGIFPGKLKITDGLRIFKGANDRIRYLHAHKNVIENNVQACL